MPLRASGIPLAARYDVVLVDLDGVVYVGRRAVPAAPGALREARRSGARPVFVTNNASREPAAVAGHLRELGVEAAADEVVTAAQAAARLVAEQVPVGAPVLVVGAPALEAALVERGLAPVRSADDAPAAVVQGFDPELHWARLAEGAYAVARGLLWVASNRDLTLPTPRGLAPGNGAMVEVLRAVTGREPQVAGKPDPALFAEAIQRAGGGTALVVGDRLDTDVAGASHAGHDSLLVLTGVTDPVRLLAAAPEERPTYLAADLAGVNEAHPPVSRDDAGWRCDGWHAVAGDRLTLTGDGDPVSGLRALCAAAWTSGRRTGAERALLALGF